MGRHDRCPMGGGSERHLNPQARSWSCVRRSTGRPARPVRLPDRDQRAGRGRASGGSFEAGLTRAPPLPGARPADPPRVRTHREGRRPAARARLADAVGRQVGARGRLPGRADPRRLRRQRRRLARVLGGTRRGAGSTRARRQADPPGQPALLHPLIASRSSVRAAVVAADADYRNVSNSGASLSPCKRTRARRVSHAAPKQQQNAPPASGRQGVR